MTEKPKVTESQFQTVYNLVSIDASINCLLRIEDTDKFKKSEIADTITYLQTLRKEFFDSFEMMEEEEPKNTMIGAPKEPPKDEESDVSDRYYDFKNA